MKRNQQHLRKLALGCVIAAGILTLSPKLHAPIGTNWPLVTTNSGVPMIPSGITPSVDYPYPWSQWLVQDESSLYGTPLARNPHAGPAGSRAASGSRVWLHGRSQFTVLSGGCRTS